MPADAHFHDADDEWATAGDLEIGERPGKTRIRNSHIIMSLMVNALLEEKKAELNSVMA